MFFFFLNRIPGGIKSMKRNLTAIPSLVCVEITIYYVYISKRVHATIRATHQHIQCKSPFSKTVWKQNYHHPFMRQATTFQWRNSDDLGEDNRLAFCISLTDRGIWFWLPCPVNLCLEHKQFFVKWSDLEY